MPKWLDNLFLCNFVLTAILGVRAVYLGRKFMNQVWLKEPENSRELGFPPDGSYGSLDTMKGWWSKVTFDDPELQQLRIRSKRAAIYCLISWVPPILFAFILMIKLIANIV